MEAVPVDPADSGIEPGVSKQDISATLRENAVSSAFQEYRRETRVVSDRARVQRAEHVR